MKSVELSLEQLDVVCGGNGDETGREGHPIQVGPEKAGVLGEGLKRVWNNFLNPSPAGDSTYDEHWTFAHDYAQGDPSTSPDHPGGTTEGGYGDRVELPEVEIHVGEDYPEDWHDADDRDLSQDWEILGDANPQSIA